MVLPMVVYTCERRWVSLSAVSGRGDGVVGVFSAVSGRGDGVVGVYVSFLWRLADGRRGPGRHGTVCGSGASQGLSPALWLPYDAYCSVPKAVRPRRLLK